MAILSYVHEIQTVYNVVQNPQMILLSEKGAHGVSSRCEKVGMLLPQGAMAAHSEEEEEEFYKLRPANKTDHLCQSWQYCHMFKNHMLLF